MQFGEITRRQIELYEAITAEGRSILLQSEKRPETDGQNVLLSLEAIWSMYEAATA